MIRILMCLTLLGLAACTTQNPPPAGEVLSSDQLNELLVGNVVVLQQGARISYASDGSYVWTTANENDRGTYAIGDSRVCVTFEDGNERCDHFRQRDNIYTVVDKNNEVGVVARIEAIPTPEGQASPEEPALPEEQVAAVQ